MYNKICYNCGFTSDPVLELIESVKYEYCPVCNSKLHKLNLFNGIKLGKMSMNDMYSWIERQTEHKVPDELRKQLKEYSHAEYLKAHERAQRSVERQEAAKQRRMNPNNIHCPTCGSNKIEKISGVSRAASVGVFGLASSKIGKTFECKNCGYKW